MPAKKRALITGVTGMVGSHLAEYLHANTDWDIIGMARWRSPLDNLSSLVGEINAGKRVRLVYADLRDLVSIQHVVQDAQPDYVFHLAAQSFPLTSFTSPIDTLDVNIQGAARILEALRQYAPESLIHICSSSEVFGRTESRSPLHEDAPFHPSSPYAISRVGSDLVGRYYAEAYGMMIMTTRMFTHTGPRRADVFAESSFAKQIVMIEKGLLPPVVHVGNLESSRTMADVRDAVRAYYMLLTVNPVCGEYYNIGGDHTCTMSDILELLLSMSPDGKNIEIRQDPSRLRPIDADWQMPDATKFREHTGWRPEIPFEQTMQDLLKYWRDRVASGVPLINR